MFSIFKRKREHEHPHMDSKISSLNESVRTSFHHIKSDMTKFHDWIKELEQHHNKHYERFKEYDKKISNIEEKISQLYELISEEKKIKPESLVKETIPTLTEFSKPENINKSLWNSLTDTKKNFLYTLSIILQESGLEWIPMKMLTEELYPNKTYNDVKSMISIYTENLQDLGFIKKTRKGREIFITITEKTKEFLPKKTLKNQIKIKETKEK